MISDLRYLCWNQPQDSVGADSSGQMLLAHGKLNHVELEVGLKYGCSVEDGELIHQEVGGKLEVRDKRGLLISQTSRAIEASGTHPLIDKCSSEPIRIIINIILNIKAITKYGFPCEMYKAAASEVSKIHPQTSVKTSSTNSNVIT
jgi:hypothetical protein